MSQIKVLFSLALLLVPVEAYLPSLSHRTYSPRTLSSTSLLSAASKLPPGLSPFDKKKPSSSSAATAIPDALCKIAATALAKAIQDDVPLLEVEFPPLAGTKTQFDDFDNLSELDANRDWSLQLATTLRQQSSSSSSAALSNRQLWLVLPDDKEVELASQQQQSSSSSSSSNRSKRPAAALLTSIRAACTAVVKDPQQSLVLPWGSSLASAVNKLTGGDGILADSSCLDALDESQKRVHLICQPGNGGPVEDWINVQALHESSTSSSSSCSKANTVIINGALDKVRDGFYPALFFPALAKTVPFYQQFQAALYLKPVSDKGVYGWIYRVYPEPWQVILQTPVKNTNGQVVRVEEQVALTSNDRPTYARAVQALLKARITQQQ